MADKTVVYDDVEQILQEIKEQKPTQKQKNEWREALINSLTLPHLSAHFLELFKAKIFSKEDGVWLLNRIQENKDELALTLVLQDCDSFLKFKIADTKVLKAIASIFMDNFAKDSDFCDMLDIAMLYSLKIISKQNALKLIAIKNNNTETMLTPYDYAQFYKIKLLSLSEVEKWAEQRMNKMDVRYASTTIFKLLYYGVPIVGSKEWGLILNDIFDSGDIGQMTRLVANLYGTKYVDDEIMEEYFDTLLFKGKTTDYIYAVSELKNTGALTQDECRVMHNMDVLHSNFKPATIEKAMSSELYSQIIVDMALNSLELSCSIADLAIENKDSVKNLFDVGIKIYKESIKNNTDYCLNEVVSGLVYLVEAYYDQKFITLNMLKEIKEILLKEEDWIHSNRLELFECLFNLNNKIFSNEELLDAKNQFIKQLKEARKNQDTVSAYYLICDLTSSYINWEELLTATDKKLFNEIIKENEVEEVLSPEDESAINAINTMSVMEYKKNNKSTDTKTLEIIDEITKESLKDAKK